MPSLLLIQWGIVGFFVVIHFLLGFLRGGSKSTYFSIVSIIMTIVTLVIVANISLTWIFGSSFTFVSLIQMIQNYTGPLIPDEFIVYLDDPALTGFAIAIIDLIIRIIAFFLFYPFIKWSLTMTIFRPIWKHGVKKAILKKQNQKQLEIHELKTPSKKFVPSKKLRKPILGRLFGGFMGSIRGAIVAFIFLIPILVLASFTSGISSAIPVESRQEQTLSSDEQSLLAIPSEIQEILDNIDDMNQNGLSAITRDITIEGKSLDRYIFDAVFTTKIVDATEDVKSINFGQELEGIIGIATILLEGGYLDDGFDYQTISSDNLDDVEQIFNYVGQSNLIAYMIPFATQYGLSVIVPEMTEYGNPYDNPDAAAALNTFTSINWTNEFDHVYEIIEAVLEFGSVSELMNYANNPELLLEMTPEEATQFTNIIRAFGNMETLVLLNAGIGYATTLDEVQSQISWMEKDEAEIYLQERLSFILDDPEFFTGESGEIGRFADFIEAIFSDEYGDVDLVTLFNSTSDTAAFLENQNPEWIGSLIEKLVEIQLLVELIPLGVDYGIYNTMGDQIERELADEIANALQEIEWDQEIINIGEIYTELLKIGISKIVGAEPELYVFVDELVSDHMDSARTIVEKIFEGSAVVNTAIEIASPVIVDQFIDDPVLKDLVNETLMSDPESGVVDFSFGGELNAILTVIEAVYQFTSATELASFSAMTQDEKVELFSNFGSLTTLEYQALEDAIQNLQLLDRMGVSALDYAKTSFEIEALYVPTEVNLGEDISAILGLAYYAAQYTYDNRLNYDSYEAIDFAPLLDDATFRSYLMSTELENHSNLIFTNIAYNIKRLSEDESLSNYLAIPSILLNADVEDTIWETEINAFLGAILDLGASFEGSTVIDLSVRDILLLRSDTSTAPMELFTQFAQLTKATNAFGSLDSSLILRTSMVNIINTFGASTEASIGHALSVPSIALDGEMLAQGMIVEFINGFAVVAKDAFETMGVETLADIQALEGNDAYLDAFSQLEDQSIQALSDVTIIRGMISDALLSPDLQTYLVETINAAQELFIVDDSFFAVDPILIDIEGAVKAEEISHLLIAIRSLGLTNSEALASLGIDTFTAMIDRNIDPETHLDDFDRVLNSGIIYITLDKILQLEAIGDFVGETLNTSLGTTMETFNLSMPDAALGNAIDDEPIEIDRIPKDEFRRMINSLGVLGDLSTIGLDTFSNLVDPTLAEDDFTTFIASDFIYIVLGRLFEEPAFGDYVGDMLSGAFGDDPISLVMGAPDDAKGTTGVEEGLMTRYELRRLMISFDMLGLGGDTDISIATIMDMIGANVDPDTGDDDFNRFLESKFLTDKISQLLLSQQVVELIAADRFTYNDFIDTLPDSATLTAGTRERLTNQEVYDLFAGLDLLGLSDFDNVDIGLDTVTSLTSPQIDELLSSSYLYTVVDLMIKTEESLSLPDSAFESEGLYIGMIKKTEVQDVFLALDILGITDLTDVDPQTITISDVTELLGATDSAIVQSLLSQAIIDALDPEGLGKIPDDAYEGNPEDGLLSNAEIDALIDALSILSGGDTESAITDIDTENITVGNVDDLSDTESAIIKQLLSDAIIDAIGADSIPPEAYGLLQSNSNETIILLSGGIVQLDASTPSRITDDELQAMIDALIILANNNLDTLVTEIETDVNVGQAVQLKGTASFIIKQLVSDTLIETLGADAIPIDAYIDQDIEKRLTDAEIDYMIDALVILANDDDTLLVVDISTDINLGQVKQLTLLPSAVTKQLISDAVVDAIDPNTEGKIPDEAYMDGLSTTRLTDAEISAMVDALDILADHNDTTLMTEINTDVTVGQVKELKGTASYIIKKLVSDAIVENIGADNIPLEAYEGGLATNRLSDAEIDAMIDALDILGEDDILIQNINTAVTVGQAVEFKNTPSYIVKQLLSDAIIDGIDPLSEGKIPLAAHIDQNVENRLNDDEINAMIDALEILANGDSALLVTAISTDVNIGQVKGLNALTSSITEKLISDAIIEAVGVDNVPLDAYVDQQIGNNLAPEEVNAMILALEILAGKQVGDPEDAVDAVSVVGISTDVKNGQTQQLKTNNSVIIKQIVSDAVVDMIDPLNEGKIPLASYNDSDPTDRLTDAEIEAMIDAIDILAKGDDNAFVTAISTDVNIGQVKGLNALSSLVIEKLISDSIIEAVGVDNVPLDAYVDQQIGNNLTPEEVNAMILALEILAGKQVGDPEDAVDAVSVVGINTDVTIGQTQQLDTTVTGSSIIKFIISDSMITMIGAANIPDDAYHLVYTDRLSDDEIGDMLDVLSILGDEEDAVSAIEVDITIGQLKSLNDSPSLIMEKLISDSVIDAVGADNVPLDAYVGEDTNNYLTEDEIAAMILALEVLQGSTVPGDVDNVKISLIDTDVTIGQTQQLDTSATGSAIIKFIISDSIITMIGAEDIPDDAYHLVYTDRLSDDEIGEMLLVLSYLGESNDKVSLIDVDITIGQLKNIENSDSLIMTQLISDSIIDAVGLSNVPNDAYILDTPGNHLKPTEVEAMIIALEVFAGKQDGDPEDVVDHIKISAITTTGITVGKTQDLSTSNSSIIKFMISDAIITMFTTDNIPDDAYHLTYSDRLKDEEIVAMATALGVLGDDGDPVQGLGIDVTVGQTQALDTTETGSVIIKQRISDSIVQMLTAPKIRQTAYINNDPNLRLIDSEIGYMQDSLLILAGGNPNLLVTGITVNENTLGIDTLQSFDENSIILNRLISNAIIDGLGADDIPFESYEDSVAKTDLIRPEIDAVLLALELLGIDTSGAGGIGMVDLRFSILDQVIAIGTTDLDNYPLTFSPIVVHILSAPMISAVTDVRSGHDYGVPTTAYRNTNDLLHAEIVGLVDALKLIGNVQPEDSTTVADVTVDPDNFDGTMINSLIALDALIVYRLISKGINDATIDTELSHVVSATRNYDPDLPAVPLIYDIKIAEMNHIANAMNILGIGSIATIVDDITLASLKALDAAEIEELVEATVVPESDANTIIYYIISETVDPLNNAFDLLVATFVYPGPADDYYVMSGATRMRLKRSSIALAVDAL